MQMTRGLQTLGIFSEENHTKKKGLKHVDIAILQSSNPLKPYDYIHPRETPPRCPGHSQRRIVHDSKAGK